LTSPGAAGARGERAEGRVGKTHQRGGGHAQGQPVVLFLFVFSFQQQQQQQQVVAAVWGPGRRPISPSSHSLIHLILARLEKKSWKKTLSTCQHN